MPHATPTTKPYATMREQSTAVALFFPPPKRDAPIAVPASANPSQTYDVTIHSCRTAAFAAKASGETREDATERDHTEAERSKLLTVIRIFHTF